MSGAPVSRFRRIHVDKGYHGHNHPHRFRVWISGQVRRVTNMIRREMRLEPVIGHLKADHRMDRNYLKGREGDRANTVLATTSACSCAGSRSFCAPRCCSSFGASLTYAVTVPLS
jgi:IS5 family transposase